MQKWKYGKLFVVLALLGLMGSSVYKTARNRQKDFAESPAMEFILRTREVIPSDKKVYVLGKGSYFLGDYGCQNQVREIVGVDQGNPVWFYVWRKPPISEEIQGINGECMLLEKSWQTGKRRLVRWPKMEAGSIFLYNIAEDDFEMPPIFNEMRNDYYVQTIRRDDQFYLQQIGLAVGVGK
jgi:hypothetical protein